MDPRDTLIFYGWVAVELFGFALFFAGAVSDGFALLVVGSVLSFGPFVALFCYLMVALVIGAADEIREAVGAIRRDGWRR